MSIIFMSQSATRCNQVYDNASHTFTDADIAANLTKFTDPLGQVVQVVTLRGTTRDARDWYLDFSAFHDYRTARVERAGHWVHHDQFEEFMRLVEGFLAE